MTGQHEPINIQDVESNKRLLSYTPLEIYKTIHRYECVFSVDQWLTRRLYIIFPSMLLNDQCEWKF